MSSRLLWIKGYKQTEEVRSFTIKNHKVFGMRRIYQNKFAANVSYLQGTNRCSFWNLNEQLWHSERLNSEPHWVKESHNFVIVRVLKTTTALNAMPSEAPLPSGFAGWYDEC